MTREEFNKLVYDKGFGEAIEMLRVDFKDEITTYEDLVDYCISELKSDGDFASVKNILETLDESYGYWVYDYMVGNVPPRPVLSVDDLGSFFDGYTYFLMKNNTDGVPWEMLKFKGKVNQAVIQSDINRLELYYIENEELMEEASAYDYMINQLSKIYDFEVVPWDCENNLYY